MKRRSMETKSLVLCALFCALIWIGAFIQVPVPMGDYFTLQFLFVLLAGFLLGPRLGALAVGIYVLMGLAGLPVFAAGGGLGYIFRPSFGYLLGFIVSAWLVGMLYRRISKRNFGRCLLAAFSGMAVTYLIGFAYKLLILNLYLHEPTALWAVIAASLAIDIPGDILLCLLAARLAPRLERIARKGGLYYVAATNNKDN